MIVPLRFAIEEIDARPASTSYPFMSAERESIHRVSIEFYDTTSAQPVIRGYELLRALEQTHPSMGWMTENALSPGSLKDDHVAYLRRLRDEIDRLLDLKVQEDRHDGG